MIGMHCDTLNAVNKHEEKSSTASDKRLLDADAGGVMLLLCVFADTGLRNFYTHLCAKHGFFLQPLSVAIHMIKR